MRAEFRLKSPKAIGNANHLHIEKSGLRDGGRAGLSALRTPEILNPIVFAFRHLPNMRPESGVFQSELCHIQTDPLPIFGADPTTSRASNHRPLGTSLGRF
jgi:hypothetical protein